MISDIKFGIWVSQVVTWIASMILMICTIRFVEGPIFVKVGGMALATWNFG